MQFATKPRSHALIFSALLLMAGCSATSKMVGQGKKAEKRGDYYAAVKTYLNVLCLKPQNAKALAALSAAAEPAYQQKLELNMKCC